VWGHKAATMGATCTSAGRPFAGQAGGSLAATGERVAGGHVGGPLSAKLWMPLPLVSPAEMRARRSDVPRGQTPRAVSSGGGSGRQRTGTAAEGSGGTSTSLKLARQGPPVDDTPVFRAGNWETRGRFLPTLQGADDNPMVTERFRRCVEERDLTAVKLLLHAGVHPDLPIAPMRRAALHLAAERGDVLMCQLLLSFSADPKQLDATPPSLSNRTGGLTPMDIARARDDIPLNHLFTVALAEASGRLGPSLDSPVENLAGTGMNVSFNLGPSTSPADAAAVLLDLGPRPPPRRSHQPLRVTPTVKEPDFSSRPPLPGC